MNVILRKKIKKLGNIGEEVVVKNGFARNYLLPNHFAVAANATNRAKVEAEKSDLLAQAEALLQAAVKASEKLDGYELTLTRNAKEESNELFGSVYPKDIVEAMKEDGLDINAQQIVMTDGAIKTTGEFQIKVSFHADVEKPVRLTVVAA